MTIRAIVNLQITTIRNAINPELTQRQKVIVAVAVAALAVLTLCLFMACRLKNRIVTPPVQPDDQKPKEPAEIQEEEKQIPVAVDPLPHEEPAPEHEESAIIDPPLQEELAPEDAEEKQVELKPEVPPIVDAPIVISPRKVFTYQGLDRASVGRIINYGPGDPDTLDECEALAPDLLRFIHDDEIQKKTFYPDEDLPEGVRIAASSALEEYLKQIGAKPIEATLRLLVLNGDLAWSGGSPRYGTYAGLDLAHRKAGHDCFTRDDLIKLDQAMQRECWKKDDLPGLTPEEADIYSRIVNAQNHEIYLRFLYKLSQVLEIKGLYSFSQTPSLLKKLVTAGKIHAYNFTQGQHVCHLMLTPHDEKRMDSKMYVNWVDQQLLQKHEALLLKPDPASPNATLELQIVGKINQEFFNRLVSGERKAFEYKSASFTDYETEQILKNLIRKGLIHSYASRSQTFYIKLTAADTVVNVPFVKGWVDEAVLQAYDDQKLPIVSQQPSPLENKLIARLNSQLFARLTANETTALEFKSESYAEISEAEQILQDLIRKRHIHSYADKGQALYIKMTDADDVKKIPFVQGWVDDAVLQAYDALKLPIVSQQPSPLEKKLIARLNSQLFARLTANETTALEFKAENYDEILEAEQILQNLMRGWRIVSYGQNDKTLYVTITDTDDVKKVRGVQGWVDDAVLQAYDALKLPFVSQQPSMIEYAVIHNLNRQLFERMIAKKTNGLEFTLKSFSDNPEVEQILRTLIEKKRIWAYSDRGNRFYIQITRDDGIARWPAGLWLDQPMLQRFNDRKLKASATSNDSERKIINELNRGLLWRLNNWNETPLVLSSADSTLEMTTFTELTRTHQIHSYALHNQLWYVRLSVTDDITQLPKSLDWKTS